VRVQLKKVKDGREKKLVDEEDGMEVTVFPSDSHKLTTVN